MEDSHLPSPAGTQLLVNLTGARIIANKTSYEDPDVYLPNHEEIISHIAVDIGGSLAKVVYFTRASKSASSTTTEPSPAATALRIGNRTPSPPESPARPNGILIPKSLSNRSSFSCSTTPVSSDTPSTSSIPSTTSTSTATSNPIASASKAIPPASGYPPFQSKNRRRSSTSTGGRLNFTKFETTDLSSLLTFLSTLISSSATAHNVPLEVMKRNVKIMATGGGAHKFFDRIKEELGVEVRREEEMECLVLGLGFVMEVPHEVFWYSDELVQAISHPNSHTHSNSLSASHLINTLPTSPLPPPAEPSDPFPRPSPNPPQYSLSFDPTPLPAQFPCLLVNIGSGVSIIKVDDYGKFERISGTSLGGGTLWGLLSLLTGAKSFDDMLALADKGDNSSVDMLVGDIYGQDYQKIGLKSSTIASSFGKVFRQNGSTSSPIKGAAASVVNGEGEEETKEKEKEEEGKKDFKAEDISRSLLYAISNNIGQIAYMNAEKHDLDRIYFGGGFIRGHAATISTLSYAIRFWSKGTKKALFLRHEGYLGGIGAWLKNLDSAGVDTPRAGDL